MRVLPHKFSLVPLLAGLGLCFSTMAFAQEACRWDRVDVTTAKGSVGFLVEVADTAEERALGLMNRPEMAAERGMLFIYPAPDNVAFWMANTLIPLDMIFLDTKGEVKKIHENAKPLDHTSIPGGTDIQYVLEINGGLARRLGLKEGAHLRHPAIGDKAAWKC